MKGKIIIRILSFFILLPISNALQPPQEHAPIILILDGSGSMWGKIGNETKISIARNVINKALTKMEASQPIGLVAYGHRQKSDCNDIETLIPSGINNHNDIKRVLDKINPTGKTPLANTALSVIQKLKESRNSATIILVSDGEESCGGDLCAVVKEAKKAGVDFVLHIVGFDLDETNQLSLKCAAEAGNGVYLNAKDEDQLSEALNTTTTMTVENQEPTLMVKVQKDGQLHDATVSISKAGDSDYFASKRTYNRESTNPAAFSLPAGTYDVIANPLGTNAESMMKKGVVISEENIEEIILDFSAGTISILSTANDKLWDSVVNIYKKGESKPSAKGRTYASETSNPMIKELSPGKYEVTLSPMSLLGNSVTQVTKDVEVIAGQQTKVEHNYEYGALLVTASNNGEKWDCVININEGKNYLKGGRTGTSPERKPKKYLLGKGSYDVLFKPHSIYGDNVDHTIKKIEVAPFSTQNIKYNYETGIAKISAMHEGQLWKSVVSIYKGDQLIYNKRTSSSTKNNPLNIHLLPGKYKVEISPVKLDKEKQTFSLDINNGAIVERAITF